MMTYYLQGILSCVFVGFNQSNFPSLCACPELIHVIGWELCGMLSVWLEAVPFCESSTTWVELGLAVGIKCWLEMFCAPTLDNIATRRPHRGGAKSVHRSIDVSIMSYMTDVMLKKCSPISSSVENAPSNIHIWNTYLRLFHYLRVRYAFYVTIFCQIA